MKPDDQWKEALSSSHDGICIFFRWHGADTFCFMEADMKQVGNKVE
jgi:hypothetical protein